MNAAFSSAAEFYALRDHRTRLCPGAVGYEGKRILVTADDAVARSPAGQIALYGLCCQLARWCRAVSVELAPMPSVLPGFIEPELAVCLWSAMAGADPFGSFPVEPKSAAEADIHIHIGSGFWEPRAQSFIQVSYEGCRCSVSPTKVAVARIGSGDRDDALGAAAASCLACAMAFQFAVGAVNTQGSFELNLWSLTDCAGKSPRPFPGSAPLAIGDILLVGAGSVGSAAAYWMRLLGVAGRMEVVDHDVAKIENINRGLLFTVENAASNKAEIVERLFRDAPLRVHAFKGDWNEYLKSVGRKNTPKDIWLPLANERNVRGSMQENIPPVMIQASTTRNWGVNFGRHVPFRDDCILDRFPVGDPAAQLACATGKVKSATKTEFDAALPFLSAFAGLLVTTDLVRSTSQEYLSGHNFAAFDFSDGGFDAKSWNREPEPACTCRRMNRSIWQAFNSQGRLAALSA